MGLFLQYAWLIPLFPLLSFAIITLTPIRMSKTTSDWLMSELLRVTVPVATPPLSFIDPGAIVTDSVSKSVTSTFAEPPM